MPVFAGVLPPEPLRKSAVRHAFRRSSLLFLGSAEKQRKRSPARPNPGLRLAEAYRRAAIQLYPTDPQNRHEQRVRPHPELDSASASGTQAPALAEGRVPSKV